MTLTSIATVFEMEIRIMYSTIGWWKIINHSVTCVCHRAEVITQNETILLRVVIVVLVTNEPIHAALSIHGTAGPV